MGYRSGENPADIRLVGHVIYCDGAPVALISNMTSGLQGDMISKFKRFLSENSSALNINTPPEGVS